jgi:hypothetical protein
MSASKIIFITTSVKIIAISILFIPIAGVPSDARGLDKFFLSHLPRFTHLYNCSASVLAVNAHRFTGMIFHYGKANIATRLTRSKLDALLG